MADIRIKDLAVTAGSSASDDYLAVDGSTNGTRKLSAYSPTFGGNLTVSGTGTSTFSGNLRLQNTAYFANTATVDATTKLTIDTIAQQGIDIFRSDANANYSAIRFRNSANNATNAQIGWNGTSLRLEGTPVEVAGNLTVSGASYNNFTGALWLGTTAGYGTLNVGNVSGTGTATYSCLTIGDQNTPANATGLYMRGTTAVCGISTAGAPIAFFTGGPGTSEAARFFNNGNFGIGTGPTDGGQKLQVSGTAAVVSSGTDQRTFLATNSAGSAEFGVFGSGKGYIGTTTNDNFEFYSNNTLALTLDSSQNATFVGNVFAGGQVKSTITSDYCFNAGPTGGADRNLAVFGVSGVTNGMTVKWNNATGTIRVNIQNLPTSATGLAAGDIWNDSGTLKIA